MSETIRFPEEGYYITPFYANSAPIACSLLKVAVEFASANKPKSTLSMDIPDFNLEGVGIMEKEIGVRPTYAGADLYATFTAVCWWFYVVVIICSVLCGVCVCVCACASVHVTACSDGDVRVVFGLHCVVASAVHVHVCMQVCVWGCVGVGVGVGVVWCGV